jgi:hypothetical protein
VSLQSQVVDLLALGAQDRLDMWGKVGRMVDQAATPANTFLCYYTPVRSSEQLTEALFKGIHDSIVRVPKTEQWIDATVGKELILIGGANDGSDLTLRIGELGHSTINPEYVLGCTSLF